MSWGVNLNNKHVSRNPILFVHNLNNIIYVTTYFQTVPSVISSIHRDYNTNFYQSPQSISSLILRGESSVMCNQADYFIRYFYCQHNIRLGQFTTTICLRLKRQTDKAKELTKMASMSVYICGCFLLFLFWLFHKQREYQRLSFQADELISARANIFISYV